MYCSEMFYKGLDTYHETMSFLKIKLMIRPCLCFFMEEYLANESYAQNFQKFTHMNGEMCHF